MSDETKTFRTTFQDPDKAHDELESHRGRAIQHFGGHVHIVKTNSSSIPTHDEAGNSTGWTVLMTSVWKKAPEDPASDASNA